MLKKINPCGVESDDGFSMQIIGPETLQYLCREFKAKIDLDYDEKLRKIYVHVSHSPVFEYYTDQVEIIEQQKLQMIKNIIESVKLLKGNFIIK